MSFDVTRYREALGCFVTGVTVIAARDSNAAPRGFTANSFTSVSLDPPLILVCIDRTASSFEVFAKCDSFSVNVLSSDQRSVSGLFATKRDDKFDHVAWSWSERGCPVLDGVLAQLVCRPHHRIEAGDHLVLVGEVVSFRSGSALPLVYFRGGYVSFGLVDHDVERIDGRPAVSGFIASWRQDVLLCRPEGASQWELPLSTMPIEGSSATGRHRLDHFFRRRGTEAGPAIPYSVFDSDEHEAIFVIFRAELQGPPEEGILDGIEACLFAPDEIPWSGLHERLYHTTMKRFLRERATERFGIYSNVAGFDPTVHI